MPNADASRPAADASRRAASAADAPAHDDVNALLDGARVPFAVSGAAAALAAAGLVVGLVGVQNVTLVSWAGAWAAIPWSLVALGAAALAVAAKLMRARSWSLAAGLGLSIALALAAVAFLVLAFVAGAFSPLTIFAIVAAVAAVVFTALAVRPFRAVAATRRRLRDAGFDLDL